MNTQDEERLVSEIKLYISNNVKLSEYNDEALEEKIEGIVAERLKGSYCPIDKRVSIVQQIFSSIRGFGLLDNIMNDDAITEVMVNGPDHIFIEKNGVVQRLDRKFESERRLEDIIQRIVGLAGREVNQANPIVDTRLPDGSRVNVVLPPIALCGPTITIRKFSKNPMTIERLIAYGSITKEIAGVLETLVKAKYNIFISGGTGSGKTTFLKKYAEYLIAKGQNIGILENDFGAVNVDMMLLQDLMGDNCELEMVSGGCDADCHRRRFKTKLIAMGMCGYDRVIVEPSGIFDVDEFFDALREEPLDRWYEVGNVIAIVDANLEEHLSEEAEYILASEVANAGEIILSHADEVSAEQADTTVAHLNRALEQIKCPRRVDKEVLRKSTLDLNEEDFNRLISCGYQMESYRKLDMEEKKGFESVYFMNVKMTEEQLKTTVGKLMNDRECGEVFRVKGFLQKEDRSWIQLNATHNGITMNPIEKGQEVIIVIGEELKEQAIKNYFLKQDNL